MDQVSRAFYNVTFERNYIKLRGNEFQNFFADLMEKGYPKGDFIRVRPWGKQGDRKNDGYLKSKRTLFQIYAPNEMRENEAIKKIDEDFSGALPYWEKYFNNWVFTHNAWDGLGPGITAKLLALSTCSKDISVQHWGIEELRKELFLLNEEDIRHLLGNVPNLKDLLTIGYEDLMPVLKHIKAQSAPGVPDLRSVPRNKIEINKLSDSTEKLIEVGRYRGNLVGEFLKNYPTIGYADEIVEAFRLKYRKLKSEGNSPDEIFHMLQIFAGGELILDPRQAIAVLSVLSYLFDECDIFERESKTPS